MVAALADDTFKCKFDNENVLISMKKLLKFVAKGQIYNIPALVQMMAWRRASDKPLSEAMMVSNVYRRWYASLGLNDLNQHMESNEIMFALRLGYYH